jgi:hypothetical protein
MHANFRAMPDPVPTPSVVLWTLDLPVLRCAAEWSPKGDWIAIPARAGTILVSPDGKRKRILRSRAFSAMTLVSRRNHPVMAWKEAIPNSGLLR